jgi:hypothetical protein
MAVPGGNYYDIARLRLDQDDVIEIAGLEKVMGLTFQDFIYLRITDTRRVLRVVMTFGLDPFAAEIAGGDDGQVIAEVVGMEPVPVRV